MNFLQLLYSNEDLNLENYSQELAHLKKEDLDAILYYLWRLPKWKRQVSSIQMIVDHLSPDLLLPLLKLTSCKIETVSSDRKDKFYFLIDLLFRKIEVKRDNLEIILSYADESLLSYYWRIIIKKLNLEDKEIQAFLVGYLAYCPPSILYVFEGIQLDKSLIREIVKRDNLGYPNRGFLCMNLKETNA